MEIDPQDYLTPSVAARAIGVDAETVRRWCRTGRIRAVQTHGGRWLVHRDVLKLRATGGAPRTTSE